MEFKARKALFKTTVKGDRDCCNRENKLNSIYTRDRWKFIANRVVEGGSDWEITNRNLGIVLANFRCQLPCTAFPGVSVSRILEEISIWIGRLSKENCPHQCKWASPNPLRAWSEQKDRGKVNLLCLSWNTHLLLLSDISITGSLAFRLEPGLIPSAPWFSSLWTWI